MRQLTIIAAIIGGSATLWDIASRLFNGHSFTHSDFAQNLLLLAIAGALIWDGRGKESA